MAQNAYMFLSLNGSQIDGESTVNTLAGIDLSQAIELVECRFKVGLTEATNPRRLEGRRIHAPFWGLKRIDKATPQLFQGLVNTMQVDAKIHFFRPDPDTGEIENYFDIELQRGRLSQIEGYLPHQLTPHLAGELSLEAFEIVYHSILLRHNIAGTEAQDTFSSVA